MSYNRRTGTDDSLPVGRIIGLVLLAVVVIVGLFTLHGSYVTVEQTEVGVLTSWGKADPNTLGPGGHWVNPWGTEVHQIHVGTQTHTFKSVIVYTKEQQSLTVSGIVNYNVDAKNAYELYSQYKGTDFISAIFDPAFQSYIKTEVATLPAAEVQQSRPVVEKVVLNSLTRDFGNYGIDVRNVYLNDMHFDGAYQKAVEDKQVAVQNAQKEQANVAVKQAQAAQAVAAAEGDKQVKIKAAEGDAQANALKQQSVTPSLIDYLKVQNQQAAIAKWNGTLPSTELSGNAMTFLGLTK